jgi:cyclin B
MLMMLDFNIVNPSSFRFLERFSKIAGMNLKQFNLARYLIELPLIEYRMLKYSPSNIAASAVYLTLKILPKYDENN